MNCTNCGKEMHESAKDECYLCHYCGIMTVIHKETKCDQCLNKEECGK